MKRKTLFSSLVALAIFFSFGLGVFAAPKLTVWFNNKSQKTDIRMINNKPYLPLYDVVSWFGGKVSYDSKTNIYKVTSKDFNPNPAPNPVKSYSLNVTQTSGPIQLKMTKVTLNPAYKKDQYSNAVNALIFDVQISNTSNSKVSFYPAQGIYALNTGEQIDNTDPLINSDNISGDFLGGATKSGKLVIPIKGKLDQLNSVHFNISGPIDFNSFNQIGDDLDFTVQFK